MLNLLTLRTYRPSDECFIFTTLLSGIYYGKGIFSDTPKTLFIREYRKIVKRLLERNSTYVVLACLKDDPEEIKGYAIFLNHGRSLFWVYVRTGWRNQGIAKSFLPDTLKEFSQNSELGKKLVKIKLPHLIFNPMGAFTLYD